MFNKCIFILSILLLASCGGSQSSGNAVSKQKLSYDDSNLKKLNQVKTGTCFDGNENNSINAGFSDPFYVNSWHLNNTGSNQVVSAAGTAANYNNANDDALAGIDANVEAVHQNGRGCTGKGIKVAIVDSGLEINHEDLAANVVTHGSFSFIAHSDDPSPSANMNTIDHGTGVAGIVSSRGWNGKGTRGLAPLAKLSGFPTIEVTGLSGDQAEIATLLSFGATSFARQANAFYAQQSGMDYTSMIDAFGQRASLIDVFNFSAGSEYPAPDKRIAANNIRIPFHEAVKYAATNLRGGKGAVVLQAAGNSFISPGFNPDLKCVDERLAISDLSVTFRNADAITCGSSNHEPYGKPYAYQVASIHNNGRASSYSSAGSDVWITGFGGEGGILEPAIVTTDNTGCHSGFNNIHSDLYKFISEIMVQRMLADQKGENSNDPNCNYTGRMNGTSAATPSVSGVVALMLEANPNLTQKDVGYILAKTARKVDADIALDARQPKVKSGASQLILDLPWQTNDGGFHFQNRYGFGLVDAKAAVSMAASNYQAPQGRRAGKLVAQAPVSKSSARGLFQMAQTSVLFSDVNQTTGALRLDITLTNTSTSALSAGYLQFELVNKTGKKSILMPAFTVWFTTDKSQIAPNKSMSFRFQTNAFYGESLGQFDVNVTSVSNKSFRIDKAMLTSFSI